MPQSLANLHVHLVFSTKQRSPLIKDAIREPLHAYLAVVLQDLNCPANSINSVDDHVHLLFDLSRLLAISDVVKKIKTASSKWIKTKGIDYAEFAWQAGYGAFAVSESNVTAVRDYIHRQRKHHQKVTFQDEYRAFLERHRVAFDEQYVWD